MRQRVKIKGMDNTSAENTGFGDMTDEALMLRFGQGNSAAFDELFNRYKKRIYNYVYRFLGNQAQSEEVVQEGFLRIINIRERYKPRAKFSTLFYGMVRNLCIDQLRKSSHLRVVKSSGTNDCQPIIDRIASSSPNQQELFHQRQLEVILKEAISTLNPEQREVFLMREKLSLPFAEIAEVLGCSENTVKSRMRYALNSLRKHISRHYSLEDVVV